MPASKELKLIAKIVEVGDIRPVIDAGITVDKFTDQDARMMFSHIFKYWKNRKTAGNIPTREMLAETFPTVELPDGDRMKINAAIEEFLDYDVKVRLGKMSEFINEYMNDDPDKVVFQVERDIRELQTVRRTSTDIVVADSVKDIRERYENAKNGMQLKGIPYPWDILNHETQGMVDGEFIVFYGRPKSLKTWVALDICINAYDLASQRVLIYTREMSPAQMMDRAICLLIGAPYDAFKHAYLHEIPHPLGGTMEDAFYAMLDTMYDDEKTCALESGHNKSLIITSDRQDREHGGGVMGLRRKIEDHKPDLIFVDAVYLMRNDRESRRSLKWTDQAAISQDLKEVAQDFNRPLLATLQANRQSEDQKGKSTANMAYSDSYAQDCDLGIEIIKKRVNREHNELALVVTASREMNISGFAINGDPGNDFRLIYRQAKDEYGAPVSRDGKAVMEPMIFNDVDDVKKLFFNGHDQQEERRKGGGDRPARNIGPQNLKAMVHGVR